MATLTVLRANVTARLGLDNSTSGDQTQIDYYLNEAVRKVLVATKCKVLSTTITPGASANYTLAATVLEIIDWDTTSSGSSYGLERVSVDEIMRLRRNSSASGSPTRCYALAGHELVMFYPTPSASDTFTLIYIPYPTEMSSGSHDTTNATYGGIPAQLTDCIEYYACWQLGDMDDDASSEQGERYRALYMDAIARARAHLAARGGYRLARAKVNPRKRLLVPHDNSADY